MDELRTALYTFGVAVLTGLTGLVTIACWNARRFVTKYFERLEADIENKQVQAASTAVAMGVDAAEEAPDLQHNGSAKFEHARIVAKELAPHAMARLQARGLVADVVNASVQKRRASMPDPSLSIRPQGQTPIPVTIVESLAPTNPPAAVFPRPGRVPHEASEFDRTTPAERPESKR